MDLLKLLQDLVAQLGALQAQLADAQAALDAAKKLSYDQGFADGVASLPPPPPASDKIFSQAEADALVAAAVAPLQAQVADLQSKVDGIPKLVADAVAALKADLLSKYEAAQAAESQVELDFKNLLV